MDLWKDLFLCDILHDLVDRYGLSVTQRTTDMLYLSQTLPGLFLFHDLSPGL